MMTRDRSSERGAALITVLMIIAAMSAVAVGLTQVVTQATHRARALDAQAQVRLYAVAAEEVAQAQLGALLAEIQGQVTADMPGLDETQIIPVDGGLLQVRATDATNCFDLNSLVIVAGGVSQPEPDAVDAYLQVLKGAGLGRGDAQALAAALLDWMDSDSTPGVGGAEDSYYNSERPSYRTSGQVLTNLSELRAIRGYDLVVLETLEPLVCARPQNAEAPAHVMNLNTLTEDQAPLLMLAFSGAMEVEEARRLIAGRPVGGWPDVTTFLDEPAVAQVSPELRRIERLGVITTSVEVYAEVAYRDQMMSILYLFETLPGQPVRTLRRERVG